MLDTGVFGRLCHPRRDHMEDWFARVVATGVNILVVPAIADYELRRELERGGLGHSLRRLDELVRRLDYAPITEPVVARAARLWADARRAGLPTADDPALDGDVLLGASAGHYGCGVVTDNVRHLERYCDARDWRDLA